MAFEWTDKVAGVDEAHAADINSIGHSLRDISTDAVPEGAANEYFTNARAQAAIAAVSGAAAGSLFYKDSAESLVNLGIGSKGQKLTVSGGLPVWAKSWRTIRTLTLDAAASSISVSQDDDGDAFSLLAAKVTVEIPAVSSVNGLLMRLNDISSGNYYSVMWGTPTNVAGLGYASTLFSAIKADCMILNGEVPIFSTGLRCNSSPSLSQDTAYSLLHGLSVSSITKFYLFIYSISFPIGTFIKIEGIDA